MNINATLFGQMITFALFVFVTMKYVWPVMSDVLEERKKTIAKGLADAERASRELELAQHKIADQLRDAKVDAADIVEQAKVRASRIVEEAKEVARAEGERMILLAQQEIDQQKHSAKRELLNQAVDFAMVGAEKIIKRNIDKSANQALLDELMEEI